MHQFNHDQFPMKNENTPHNKREQLFINKQIDINSLDEHGHTAFYYAVEARDLPRLRALLKSGANPNTAGDNTFPPLVWAAGHTSRC